MGHTREKRAYPRANLYLPLLVWNSDSEGAIVEENTVTVNVSSGGIYFISTNPYLPGTLLGISITVPSDPPNRISGTTIHCDAKVLRSERFRSKGLKRRDKHYGVAAIFCNGFRFAIPLVDDA